MERTFLFLGAVFAFVGVAAGAFGAHILKGRLSPDMLAVFEVGVRYQMYHALALIAVACIRNQASSAVVTTGAWCFVLGTIFFSGSLYLLSLTGMKWFGAITPLGGLAFLAGWTCLAGAAWKITRANS